MKMYLVYYGHYSDWGMLGIFDSEEKARDYAAWVDKSLGMWNSAEVMEFELNEGHSCYGTGKKPYKVSIWKSTGYAHVRETSGTEESVGIEGYGNIEAQAVVFASDEETAKKIALDRIATEKAGKAGIA